MTRTRVAAGIVLALSLAFVNPYVRGDGNGYYAWLVSPVIDRDLDFENQYRRSDRAFRLLMFTDDGQRREEMVTATGHLANQWSVGPALLWLPWFVTAHAGVAVARLWRPEIQADGYSWPYRFACAAGTMVYGWLAIVFAVRAARAVGLGEPAAAAAIVIWAASPLPVYQYFLPFHVHALSAFAVSWFVWRWLAAPKPQGDRGLAAPEPQGDRGLAAPKPQGDRGLAAPKPQGEGGPRWFEWGLLCGLMTLVYHLNAVLLLVPAYELARLRARDGAAAAIRAAATFAAAFALLWIPHAIGKGVVYGSPWTTGYGDQFYWFSPRLWQAALAAEHGLFSWTPVALAAAAGLVVLAVRRHEIRVVLTAASVFFFAVASYQNWHGQSSFGNRFFVSLVVVAVIGLAEIWRRLERRGGAARWGGAVGAALLILWNAGLAFQWGTEMIPSRGPVDFAVVARNQVTRVPQDLTGFLWRYVAARSDVVRELEERDLEDKRRYKLTR